MNLEVQCPGCQITLRVPAANIEQMAKCPQCNRTFRVPVDARSESSPGAVLPGNTAGDKLCTACRASLHSMAEICPHCGVRQMLAPTGVRSAYPAQSYNTNRLAAGICAILIGSLGIHKFILGYKTEGIIMLLITVVTLGLGSIVTSVIGIVEGVIYLTKSEEEFHDIYEVGRKGWF